MPSTTYPTRQPITQDGIKAYLAGLAANPAPRTARVIIREKRSEALIDRMADTMRHHGEGMTRIDLRRAGYTEIQIEACAEAANIRALSLAEAH